jgi:hypothetical protein
MPHVVTAKLGREPTWPSHVYMNDIPFDYRGNTNLQIYAEAIFCMHLGPEL